MKKHLLSIGLAGLLGITACSENVDVPEPDRFIRFYGSALDDEGLTIAPIPGQGYILAGNSEVPGAEGIALTHIYAARTDLDGRVLWEGTFGGNSPNVTARQVIAEEDGSAIIFGTVTTTEGDQDVLMLRTDPAGNVLDSLTYGLPGQDDIASTVMRTPNGFLVGNTIGTTGKVIDIALREIDNSGLELWTENYGNIGPLRSISAIVTTETGYAWVGTVERGTSNEIVLVATDFEGAILSHENVLPEGASSISSAGMRRVGSRLIIAGNTLTGSGKRIAIMKVRLTGTLFTLESSSILSGSTEQEVNWAEPSGSSGLLLGGYYDNGLSLEDWMLIRVDAEGNEVWRQTYGSGTGSDRIQQVAYTPQGDILLLGTVHFANNSVIALYKTDGQGNILN